MALYNTVAVEIREEPQRKPSRRGNTEQIQHPPIIKHSAFLTTQEKRKLELKRGGVQEKHVRRSRKAMDREGSVRQSRRETVGTGERKEAAYGICVCNTCPQPHETIHLKEAWVTEAILSLTGAVRIQRKLVTIIYGYTANVY